MKTRWLHCPGIAVVAFFLGCSPAAKTRTWETTVSPTDKPSVNYVISVRAGGEPLLKNVALWVDDPHTSKTVKQGMDFKIISSTRDKIEFELKEDPGDVLELSIPSVMGSSFKADLKSKSSPSVEVLQFDEILK